jgi:hypothetical protein
MATELRNIYNAAIKVDKKLEEVRKEKWKRYR